MCVFQAGGDEVPIRSPSMPGLPDPTECTNIQDALFMQVRLVLKQTFHTKTLINTHSELLISNKLNVTRKPKAMYKHLFKMCYRTYERGR